MTPERYLEVKSVYQAAEELPPSERHAYVVQACGGDASLVEEVEQLLVAGRTGDPFLSMGAAEYAPDIAKSPAGQTIGHYALKRELGAGGMGRVYLAARSDDFRKLAAIKLLRAGVDSEALIARFRIERQILAAFDHPNIARLLDGGTNRDGTPYLVMEYIDGQLIDVYCDQHRLTVEARLRLFLSVCEAVEYAHRNLVVHRDLKPANILVTQDGIPKLLDFGIAKLLRPEMASVTQAFTSADVRPMTPQYASPEQVLGAPITTAADVYSLGVILYELLTGRLPYQYRTGAQQEIFEIARSVEPTRPSTAVPNPAVTPESISAARGTQPEKLRQMLTGDLDNILLRALQKDPQRRYKSVEAFAEDIRRYLNGRPVTACKETLFYRSRKFVKRNKGPVTAAVLLAVALIAGAAATAWQAHEARVQQARAERRFKEARGLARSMMFELHDAIAALPGSTHARELLVQRAKAYLDGLQKEAADDAALQLELAAAYERIGLIQWDRYGPNLGNLDGAVVSQQKALDIRKAVALAQPKDWEAMHGLARSYLYTGDIQAQRQHFQESLADYRQALKIRQDQVAANPKDQHARNELPEMYQRIGDLLGSQAYVNMGDLAGALENYEKWRETIEQLAAEFPDDVNYRQDLALTYTELAFNHAAQGQFAMALDWLQKARPITREVLQRKPHNAHAQEDLAVNYIRTASVRAAMGDLAGALEEYQKCLEIREPLVAADPLDGRVYAKFAATLDIMSTIAAAAGRVSDAQRYMARLIAAEKNWAERPNATAHDWADYARRLLNCDPPQLRQPELALSAARKAVAMTERHDGNLLDTLARALAATGDAAQAASVEREAIAALAVTSAKATASAGDLNDYAWILVTCHPLDLRQPSVALTYAKRAAEMSSRRDPGILDTLALALFATGDRAQAIQVERDAIAKSWDAPPEKKEYTDNWRRFEAAN